MRRDGRAEHPVILAVTMLALASALAGLAGAESRGQLFPQPFVIEHHIEQSDTDGSRFVSDTVIDRYGGSWIVSERPDGSRVVVDLSRREITEMDPSSGTYTVLSFDQMAELQRRLVRADQAQVGMVESDAGPSSEQGGGRPQEPRFRVEERSTFEGAGKAAGKARALLEGPTVQHLRVTLEGAGKAATESPAALDVWVDSRYRLTEAASEALARFESDVLAATARQDEVPFSRYLQAARRQSNGAIPIRTSRPVGAGAAEGAGEVPVMEDVVTRLEALASFPVELVSVPDGYRRVPHPLEQMVSFAEEEAERNLQALQGSRSR